MLRLPGALGGDGGAATHRRKKRWQVHRLQKPEGDERPPDLRDMPQGRYRESKGPRARRTARASHKAELG
jgi:hypothetical protein